MSMTEAKKEYRKLNNELRRETEKAKAWWWEDHCDEMEQLQQEGKFGKLYSKIRQLTRRQSQSSMVIKDKGGEVVNGWIWCNTEMEGIHRRFVRQKQSSYRWRNGGVCWSRIKGGWSWAKLVEGRNYDNVKRTEECKGEEVMISWEKCWSALARKATEELIEICQQYTTGEWPSDFPQTVMIALEKKANATELFLIFFLFYCFVVLRVRFHCNNNNIRTIRLSIGLTL